MVSQHKGRWGRAEKVPGLAALSAARNAEIDSVSCASAGSCSAGGLYATRSSGRTNTSYQAFVVSQHKGRWGRAEKVPGLAALNTGGRATIYSVSCASAGSCSAGGYYADASGSTPAFVVSQHNGSWGTRGEGPRRRGAEHGRICPDQLGVMRLGGQLQRRRADRQLGPKGNTRTQAFVVSQHNGSWGRAGRSPPWRPSTRERDAVLYEVSCGAAGSCSAGGFYTDGSGHGQAFVVSQHNGTWNHARRSPAPRPSTRAEMP